MRLVITLFFLQSIFVDAQTISFIDISNNPVKDVYLEFSLNGKKEICSSNSAGVVFIDNKINSKLKVKISHLSLIHI